MRTRAGALMVLVLTALPVFGEGYLSGGSIPFPAEVQRTLDRHAPILTLGINHDWMLKAGVEPVAYLEGVDTVAAAVGRGEVPGALVYVDRLMQSTMPTGIGYRITDPQRRRVEADTMYAAQDLTGSLVTVPMTLFSLLTGDVRKDSTLGELIPELAGSDKAPITIEMLLRHRSGLPAELPARRRYADRSEMLRDLAALPLSGAPGAESRPSAANFLVLGLAMERVHGKGYSELAAEKVFRLLRDSTAVLEVDDIARADLAPGIYSDFLGRMAWGEATDSAGFLLGPDAGHTGLVLSADHAAEMARMLMTMAALNVGPDGKPLTVVGEAFVASDAATGETAMGLGYMVGRFGPGSFGWDSPTGSSIWILPRQQGFVVYLSNADHPKGPSAADPREKALPAFVRSLKIPGPAPIDTARGPGDAVPAAGTPAGVR